MQDKVYPSTSSGQSRSVKAKIAELHQELATLREQESADLLVLATIQDKLPGASYFCACEGVETSYHNAYRRIKWTISILESLGEE